MLIAMAYLAHGLVAVAWTLAYISIIYRSWRDQTYGMPIVALAANIAWEGLFTFVFPTPTILWVRNLIWFALDLVIVFFVLTYAQRELRYPMLKRHARLVVLGSIILATMLVWGYIVEFQDLRGWYSGFIMNLSMSVLFFFLFLERNDIRGQSIYVGIFKFLGTFGAAIAVVVASPAKVLAGFTGVLPSAWYPPSPFILMMYAIIAAFDWLYIVCLYRQIRACGLNPWKRL